MFSDSPALVDPLAQVVALLRPQAGVSKHVSAHGAWKVRRASDDGTPFYCAVRQGDCRLEVEGAEPVELTAGDFVLIPAAFRFDLSSLVAPAPGVYSEPRRIAPGVHRIGEPGAGLVPEVRMLIGHLAFSSSDTALLLTLLPRVVHVRGEVRLAELGELLDGEVRADRSGREAVLSRLVEILLIEALRSSAVRLGAPGLLRGLADPGLAAALRGMHERADHDWTVAALAREAAMSRSTFFERFQREVGVAPMGYLVSWRMALAKSLLVAGGERLGRIAERVGYGSVSTFSTAFARHVGRPPARYAREGRAPAVSCAGDRAEHL